MENKKILFLNNAPQEHSGYDLTGDKNGIEARKRINNNMQYLAERIFGGAIDMTILYSEDISSEEIHCELEKKYDLCIGGGSLYNICENHDWVEKIQNIILEYYKSEGKIPYLAICFAHQLIHVDFGGTLEKIDEYIFKDTQTTLTKNNETICINASHQYVVKKLGEGFELLGTSNGMTYITKHTKYPIVTIQPHPERPLQNGDWCDNEVIEFLRRELRI